MLVQYRPLCSIVRYHGGNGVAPAQSKFMPKHDEDLEGRGKKVIGK